MQINDAINQMQKVFGIKFSDEQINILKSNPKMPLLVNACAGSGKTTLFLMSIMLRALIGAQKSEEVLGITFSKKAQLDMENRYKEKINQLGRRIPVALSWDAPKFCTFHALFLRLLKKLPKYENLNVLTSWHAYYMPLAKQLDLSYTQLSTEEYLESIFNCYDTMLNNTYSLDGLKPNLDNKIVKNLFDNPKNEDIKPVLDYVVGASSDKKYSENYVKVINTYQELKNQRSLIDFNDMKIRLLAELSNNEEAKKKLNNYMRKYTQIYMDEFQDIDPMQWILIKKLVSPDTFNHIFVIGDDDQSIYSFRGSSPYYITHFKSNLMPNANVLNLSTNYRTGGKILDIARPIIEKNKARLGKSLSACNDKVGKIKVIDEAHSEQDEFFDKVISYAQNPMTQTAILVRFNRDKTIIADKLASKGYFVNVSQKGMVLQNTNIYKLFIDLIDAVLNNDASQYIKYSNKLGFLSFQYKLRAIKRTMFDNDLGELMKLAMDKFMEEKSNPNTKSPLSVKNLDTQIGLVEDTIDMLRMVKFAEKNKQMQKELVGRVFSTLNRMTNNFFTYMYRKNIYSKTATEQELDYLGHLIEGTPNWVKFKKKEEVKKLHLEAMVDTKRQMPNLQLLTMHQSKGLEFDTVFIYGLTDDVLNNSKMKLNNNFPSNMSKREFKIKLLEVRDSDSNGFKLFRLLKLFRSCQVQAVDKIITEMMGRTKVDKQDIDAFLDDDYKVAQKRWNIGALPTEGNLFLLLYYQVMNVSANVEQERRLLYVAITRAKKELYVDLPMANPSPLVAELMDAYESEEQQTKIEISNNARNRLMRKYNIDIFDGTYTIAKIGELEDAHKIGPVEYNAIIANLPAVEPEIEESDDEVEEPDIDDDFEESEPVPNVANTEEPEPNAEDDYDEVREDNNAEIQVPDNIENMSVDQLEDFYDELKEKSKNWN